MTQFKLKLDMPRQYPNAGQHAEQLFIYTATGEIRKASNLPFTKGGDFEDIQIKSARATVCKGLDLDSHLQKDKAQRYAYVRADFKVAYIMSPTEWREFVSQFGTITRESSKNGGAEKIRLKQETEQMREWLERRA